MVVIQMLTAYLTCSSLTQVSALATHDVSFLGVLAMQWHNPSSRPHLDLVFIIINGKKKMCISTCVAYDVTEYMMS